MVPWGCSISGIGEGCSNGDVTTEPPSSTGVAATGNWIGSGVFVTVGVGVGDGVFVGVCVGVHVGGIVGVSVGGTGVTVDVGANVTVAVDAAVGVTMTVTSTAGSLPHT